MRRDMVFLLLVATFTFISSSTAFDQEILQRIESSRTASEWEAIWSEERLALCRARLRHNLDAICGKDVYRRSTDNQGRFKRRPPKCWRGRGLFNGSGKYSPKYERKKSQVSLLSPFAKLNNAQVFSENGQNTKERRSPFLSVQEANLFVTTWLRGRRLTHGRTRRQSPSITSECCTERGCTWEEYAEYCPTSSRARPGIIPI
ncbi:hypothetical protein SK128_018165 [Halocaridina rubra]|uniref:Insulin-like peptide 7 n=1 Tax=Halocaridina rubra TaxID=373956 RepID=A0AAN8X677_HALRR